MSQLPWKWKQARSLSFLSIWRRAKDKYPSDAGNTLMELYMCIAFEETRFCNQVQIGMEASAAKYDSGGTVDKKVLDNLGVGYTQVQIKNEDKVDVLRKVGVADPAKLLFKDVLADHDLSIHMGLWYLAAKGIGGQVGPHPRGHLFKKAWPQAAQDLRLAMRAADLSKLIVALNGAFGVTEEEKKKKEDPRFGYKGFEDYWNFIFPPGEIKLLASL